MKGDLKKNSSGKRLKPDDGRMLLNVLNDINIGPCIMLHLFVALCEITLKLLFFHGKCWMALNF